jgi:uncharacterized protein YlxP (DUF503 family)
LNFFVGIASFRIDLVTCSSLKEKRHFVRSIVDRIGNSKIVAVAEVGDKDFWKSGVIGIACVSSSREVIMKAIEGARRTIESSGVDVVDAEQWVLKPEDL